MAQLGEIRDHVIYLNALSKVCCHHCHSKILEWIQKAFKETMVSMPSPLNWKQWRMGTPLWVAHGIGPPALILLKLGEDEKTHLNAPDQFSIIPCGDSPKCLPKSQYYTNTGIWEYLEIPIFFGSNRPNPKKSQGFFMYTPSLFLCVRGSKFFFPFTNAQLSSTQLISFF